MRNTIYPQGLHVSHPSRNLGVEYAGCDLLINTTFSGGFTNLEFVFKTGGVVLQTVNTTDTAYTWHPAALYAGETLSITQSITTTAGGLSYLR